MRAGASESNGDELTTEQFAKWWKQTGENELRQLLFWRWDPIGVSEAFPNAADEYDGYAPQVVQALRNGATESQLADVLMSLEVEAMGLSSQDSDLLPAAALLRHWYSNSQESWLNFGPPRR